MLYQLSYPALAEGAPKGARSVLGGADGIRTRDLLRDRQIC